MQTFKDMGSVHVHVAIVLTQGNYLFCKVVCANMNVNTLTVICRQPQRFFNKPDMNYTMFIHSKNITALYTILHILR